MRKVFFAIFTLVAAINSYAADYKREIWVNQDGTGDCRTITEAFELIRAYMDYEVTVHIASGVYKEKVVVPSWLNNVTFIGEDPDDTIITWGDHANMPDSNPLIPKMGTFRTYTMRVDGDNLTFENLTIENNAPELGQAVALHTEGDNLTFINCNLLGNQDTVFTGGQYTNLYFDNCYIEGTTDFIFGAATAFFKDCDIMCKRDSYITAASTPADVEVGYVFYHCHIMALPEVKSIYLGRPWRPYAHTVFIDCQMDAPIADARWHNWKNPDNEATARYGEYGSTGKYGNTDKRVPWAKDITAEEAQRLIDYLSEP